MKSNVNKEDNEAKKKYVFFSDPDVIVRRAESTAAASQALQNLKIHEQQWRGDLKVTQSEPESSINPETKSDLKGLETLLSYHPVQPYPFTFITAVKRKLALSMHADACKRVYEPEKLEKLETEVDVNRTNTDSKRGINQAAQKMDFIKPLKVPDLKISPKALDYSPRDNLGIKDIVQPTASLGSKKFDIQCSDTSNKSPKSSEKAHRKLDFSLLEGSPIKNCENIEPLKAPDVSIGSSLSKKKEHARDSSREKENRSKRIKKDDSGISRKDDSLKETPRRSKSSKHISRKDVVAEESDSLFEMFKPENFLSNAPRESDFGFKKPKSKNFLTSTVKKNDDRKHTRSISVQSVRSARERSLESKNRNYENDSSSEKSFKIYDRITTRDNFRGKINDNVEQQHKLLNQEFSNLRQCEDHKNKNAEPSSSKQQQKHSAKQYENYNKSQIKKSQEKQKSSASESDAKELNTTSDVSEEIKTASGSTASLKDAGNLCKITVGSNSETDDSLRNDISQCKEISRELGQSSSQNDKFRDNAEEMSQAENFSTQVTNTDSKIVEESLNQADSNASSSQSKSNTDQKISQSKSLSGLILDPTRISFRDESYEDQNEFCDLVTPDINLIPRSKRRKNFIQEEDQETDMRIPKYQTVENPQSKDEGGIQLLHPTALHMQFQAELHLLDTFNESLRQVMDVEKCLYGVKHEQDQELLLKQKESKIKRKSSIFTQPGRDTVDIERNQGNQGVNIHETIKKNDLPSRQTDEEENIDTEIINTVNVDDPITESTKILDRIKQPQNLIKDSDYVTRKNDRVSVRVTEVQTQTANDIATQTDNPRVRRRHNSPGRQVPGITYQRGSPSIDEIPQLSLESFDQFEDFDQIENVSLPSKMHTMSEISLHETTSSIRTETGTEISISTRDVTCSFNKYLDSELAQLIKDEKQRYDEIEMLFKSREKTLNDRTKKLVKLEEQKRALRDMGQDSRISSVKKKQRALLLKLQQEKDEMNRLKELHKKASQERKLMLQKQRNMLNPQMSTKNILTKLKRSADSQSPRRLSGPMKGYDIRSPSSMSSLVDSDKSQLDVSLINLSVDKQKFVPKQKIQNAAQKSDVKSKYETKPCKYKEVAPKIEVVYHKSHGTDLESNLSSKKSIRSDVQVNSEKSKFKETQQKPASLDMDKSISENIRSESDTLVDEISKKSKSSQATEINFDNLKLKRDKETLQDQNLFNSDNLNTESDSIAEELSSKKSKSSQVTEDISEITTSKNLKKAQSSSTISKEACKKSQSNSKIKSNSKRKGSRSLKSKSSSDILSENILRSKSGSQISEEIIKHHGKRSKIERGEALQSEENYRNSVTDDVETNESQSSLRALVEHSKAVKEKNYQLLKNIANEYEAKENLCKKDLENLRNVSARQEANLPNVGNMSTRSQVSTLTISHHSSGESEKSYSRSVVIRAQDHHFRTTKKLEHYLEYRNYSDSILDAAFEHKVLTAREAALASRRSCVEEWIAWHSRLRAEESRVARMEEAAFKLVSAASNALSYHDTTVSSDTSDVESRIEILAEKLAERRTEMARLKREAKRQAKQRLKALETNLLNQIKKYDTTIHEMRKKLENKRGALSNDVSSEKLAIESKSLTDFKIPDIPIKRIKEIYKNSDLLKSRSESELRNLISEDTQEKDVDNAYDKENSDQDNKSYRKSPRSSVSDVTDRSEISNSDKKATTQSIQSIFEDVKSTVSKDQEFVSENIETQSIISERIETNEYKSEDEIPDVTFKSQSVDRGGSDETENSNLNEIQNRKPIQIPSIDSGRRTLIISQTISQDSIISESVLENIQRADSVQQVDSESIETVPPEAKLSRSYDISEVISDLEQRGSQITVEQNSSLPKSSASKDGEVSKELKTVSPNTVDSEFDSDAIPSNILIKDSKKSSAATSSSISENEVPQTLADVSSASKGGSAVIEEINVLETVGNSQSISNKLSFLELGNKNLNDDISTLENDLKALSEMMSQFSKKSDGKFEADIALENENKVDNLIANDSDKGTSEDMTDIDYQNDTGDKEILSNSKVNATYIVEEEHDNNCDLNEKDLTAQVTEIMLKVMPENLAPALSLNRETDFKARSREILNEIEKSIISEHVKSPESIDNNLKNTETCSENENDIEEVNDVLNSLDKEIMSIAEIISHASEAKKDIRRIQNFENDILFKDDDVLETQSVEKKPSELPAESNQVQNTPWSDDTKSVTENLDETSANNFEQIFETIKDPEYEDISEESLEVSEIMDRSESTRSDRQFHQKSNRLPEKYQMTQKSEDVLRILDEISQKSNDGSSRSQQFFLTPDNHGKKINELLQWSERLSQNFEVLTKKPSQSDVGLQKTDVTNLQPANYFKEQWNQSAPESGQRNVDNILQTTEISIPPDVDKEIDIVTDVTIDDEALTQSDKDEAPFALDMIDARSHEVIDAGRDKIGDIVSAISVSEENLESKTTELIRDDSGDKASQKSNEQSGKFAKSSGESPELLEYKETDKESKENLVDTETETPVIEELEIKKVYPDKIDVAIQETENTGLMPGADKKLEQKLKVELEKLESKENNAVTENLNKLEELNCNIQRMDETIHPIHDVSLKIDEIQDTADLCRELVTLSPKSDESLNKIVATEKLDSVSQKSDESQGSEKSDDILQKYDVELPSESSEEIDTPRSVSEIEMDSPRDPNDSRLDIDGLDDDLLANDNNFATQNIEIRTEFHPTPAVATSEKDIEAMIDKLKVSLEQPGLDVAELEAKLLRIQQLQIELEIKKLEAEEVSYYVREIPNKPPPPYTPPSGGRLSVSQTSPSPAPAVVPTNVEDLTTFTERATHLIYRAKQSGDDIISLEPPTEICELSKDNNETARRDRKIYNTFLFDLCKETISEVYQSEYEKPGPSWLKPNAKTKPTMKIPKTVDGLNDYVSKEVATLFGFKTKLQRENLVMRWSRKRRDRVDELLAREAQAEEDEWTKFHHDELAVKNELTTAILDSLILDAANVVKLAYIKKRKVTS